MRKGRPEATHGVLYNNLTRIEVGVPRARQRAADATLSWRSSGSDEFDQRVLAPNVDVAWGLLTRG